MLTLLKAASALQNATNMSELTNIVYQLNTLYNRLYDEIRAAIARLDYAPNLDLILLLHLNAVVWDRSEDYSLLEEYCHNAMTLHGDEMESLIRSIFQTRDRGDETWEQALLASSDIVVTNPNTFPLKSYPAIATFFVCAMIQVYGVNDWYKDATMIVQEIDANGTSPDNTTASPYSQLIRRINLMRSGSNDDKMRCLIDIDHSCNGTLSFDRAYSIIEDRYASYMNRIEILPIAEEVSKHMIDFLSEYEKYEENETKVYVLYRVLQMDIKKDIELIRVIMPAPDPVIIRAFLFDCLSLRVLRGMHDPFAGVEMINAYLTNLTIPPSSPIEELDSRTAGIIWALQIQPGTDDSEIDWEAIRLQTDPPVNETALEAYDRKSAKLNKASQKIYNGFKAYKNAEDKVDSQLAKMISSTKRLFMGDARTEIVEGKEFSPIGLLKKALATAAIFSYSKIGGLIFLVVRYALRKNATMAEKKSILMEIETEMKMLDEKIEDARGDGNRQAKYAMMRTRSEIQNAYNKIKYGLEADKRSMSTARKIVGAGQSSADAYERRRTKR